MNAETIERLAMDRALGELNEDAAVLFDTYLAEHPEARVWAQGMSDTCAQTQRAIDSKTQDASKQAPHTRIHSHRSPRVHWARLGRWAALVAVSAGIGAAVGRWSQSQAPAPDHTVIRAASADGAQTHQQLLSGQDQGFWQSKALALLQTRPYETARSRDRQAGLWETYRQIRKERSHE